MKKTTAVSCPPLEQFLHIYFSLNVAALQKNLNSNATTKFLLSSKYLTTNH